MFLGRGVGGKVSEGNKKKASEIERRKQAVLPWE
jgi:hypothetical protein